MIVTLSDTSTREITKLLLDNQENHSLATGRVLTLIVVADIADDVESILDNVRSASHEHPARVLMLITGTPDGAASTGTASHAWFLPVVAPASSYCLASYAQRTSTGPASTSSSVMSVTSRCTTQNPTKVKHATRC